MLRLYLDCEFNGNGPGSELISLALVSSGGDEWYEVRCVPADPLPFVAAHVLPVLEKHPIGDVAFRARLYAYMKAAGDVEVVADYLEDFKHLIASLRRDHTWGYDLAFSMKLLPCGPGSECPSEIPHNALYDARALAEWCKRTGR